MVAVCLFIYPTLKARADASLLILRIPLAGWWPDAAAVLVNEISARWSAPSGFFLPFLNVTSLRGEAFLLGPYATK